jgi:hypothetical protein
MAAGTGIEKKRQQDYALTYMHNICLYFKGIYSHSYSLFVALFLILNSTIYFIT